MNQIDVLRTLVLAPTPDFDAFNALCRDWKLENKGSQVHLELERAFVFLSVASMPYAAPSLSFEERVAELTFNPGSPIAVQSLYRYLNNTHPGFARPILNFIVEHQYERGCLVAGAPAFLVANLRASIDRGETEFIHALNTLVFQHKFRPDQLDEFKKVIKQGVARLNLEDARNCIWRADQVLAALETVDPRNNFKDPKEGFEFHSDLAGSKRIRVTGRRGRFVEFDILEEGQPTQNLEAPVSWFEQFAISYQFKGYIR